MPYVTRLKADEELLITGGNAVVSIHGRSRGGSHLYLQVDAPENVTIKKRIIQQKTHHVDDS